MNVRFGEYLRSCLRSRFRSRLLARVRSGSTRVQSDLIYTYTYSYTYKYILRDRRGIGGHKLAGETVPFPLQIGLILILRAYISPSPPRSGDGGFRDRWFGSIYTTGVDVRDASENRLRKPGLVRYNA